MTKYKRTILIKFAVAFGLVGLSLLLTVLASGNPEGTARVFGPWSRFVSVFLSRLFAFMPLPIAEFLLYGLILFSLATLVLSVVRIFQRRSVRPLLNWFSSAVLVAACLLFAFLTFWGLNYYAAPLNQKEGVTEQPAEILYQTAVWLRDEMNQLASQAPRGADGACDAGGFDSLAPRAALGYDALADQGGDFVRNLTPPKRLAFSSLLVRFGISGMYVPFTGEAIVDCTATDAYLPFTLCHELAHRQGVAPEDEANYWAFLACASHPDPMFRYSGYYLAFLYCSNALSQADLELFSELWADVSPQVGADLEAQREHREEYEGPLQTVGESVNDAYLQTVGQEEGVKSYGLVVDLLIVEYLNRSLRPSG